MENLIKTKKLETRFFLTNSAHHNSNVHSKPQTAVSKNREKKDILNTTAPINLTSNTLNNTTAFSSGNSNKNNNQYSQVARNSNFNQTQQIQGISSDTHSGFAFYPSKIGSSNQTPVGSQKHHQGIYFVQGKSHVAQRHTSQGKQYNSSNTSRFQNSTNNGNNTGNSLRSKWTRVIATEVNSKNNSPTTSFHNAQKVAGQNTPHMTLGTSIFSKQMNPSTNGGQSNMGSATPNDLTIRVKKNKNIKNYHNIKQSSQNNQLKTMDDNTSGGGGGNNNSKKSSLIYGGNNTAHDYMSFVEKQQKGSYSKNSGLNQTQVVQNNFFLQPASPKANTHYQINNIPSHQQYDRNIKTAGAGRRMSSQVTSPMGNSYDFNKIKKDLESVKTRHDDVTQQIQQQQTRGNIATNETTQLQSERQQKQQTQVKKSEPAPNIESIVQQEEIIIFSEKHSLDDYVIGKQIGQGAYAIVRIGMHKKTNRKVALKMYEKEKMKEIQRKKSVRREIKLMERLNHPHIAKLYEAIETDDMVILVMEYVSGGSTHGFLKSKVNRRMEEEDAKRIFRQVTSALQYCHSKCVAHRDIKLENVMLDSRGNVKIIDFGFSTCIPNDKKIKIFCGTPSYMAPEIVAKREFCGPPADIWASGILLYAFFCGCFPFRGSNDKELYTKIQTGEFNIPDHVPTGARNLLLKILNIYSDNRPLASELYCDPWVQGSSSANNAIISGNQTINESKVRSQSMVKEGGLNTQNKIVGANTNNEEKEPISQRQKERVKSSSHYQQRYLKYQNNNTPNFTSNSGINSQPHPQISFNQGSNVMTNTKPVIHQPANYNSEAYKAYYNTAGSPAGSASPQSRLPTTSYYIQNGNAQQSPINRLFVNFHHSGNLTPNQTINNNINIINNITQVNCNNNRTTSGVNLFSTTTSDDQQNTGIAGNTTVGGGLMSSQSSFDHDILQTMTKLGLTQDEIKKQLHDGGDQYINALYTKMKTEKRALNSPIAPSFVPSLLSSFTNTPKGSQIQNNWMGIVTSQEDVISSNGVINHNSLLLNHSKEHQHNQLNLTSEYLNKTTHNPRTRLSEKNTPKHVGRVIKGGATSTTNTNIFGSSELFRKSSS